MYKLPSIYLWCYYNAYSNDAQIMDHKGSSEYMNWIVRHQAGFVMGI